MEGEKLSAPIVPPPNAYDRPKGRLSDLCPADKARVARLIQQLVTFENSSAEWAAERQALELRLSRLRNQNTDLVQEVCEATCVLVCAFEGPYFSLTTLLFLFISWPLCGAR